MQLISEMALSRDAVEDEDETTEASLAGKGDPLGVSMAKESLDSSSVDMASCFNVASRQTGGALILPMTPAMFPRSTCTLAGSVPAGGGAKRTGLSMVFRKPWTFPRDNCEQKEDPFAQLTPKEVTEAR